MISLSPECLVKLYLLPLCMNITKGNEDNGISLLYLFLFESFIFKTLMPKDLCYIIGLYNECS